MIAKWATSTPSQACHHPQLGQHLQALAGYHGTAYVATRRWWRPKQCCDRCGFATLCGVTLPALSSQPCDRWGNGTFGEYELRI